MSKFKYGESSKKKLGTCHPRLQEIADLALKMSPYDITIIHGLRDKDTQNRLADTGFSKLRFPNSKHNKTKDPSVLAPEKVSDALDFAPYINGHINWGDAHMFCVVAGCILGAARQLGYSVRWGGDWDMDGETTDQTFMDWGHIELVWE